MSNAETIGSLKSVRKFLRVFDQTNDIDVALQAATDLTYTLVSMKRSLAGQKKDEPER